MDEDNHPGLEIERLVTSHLGCRPSQEDPMASIEATGAIVFY
jgi:hypothetical protein